MPSFDYLQIRPSRVGRGLGHFVWRTIRHSPDRRLYNRHGQAAARLFDGLLRCLGSSGHGNGDLGLQLAFCKEADPIAGILTMPAARIAAASIGAAPSSRPASIAF